MRYVLMQKNYPVMDLDIRADGTEICFGNRIYDKRRIPVGIAVSEDTPSQRDLAHWWKKRSIPASRSGIDRVLRMLNMHAPQELLTKCFGLSLSDQYWVKPTDMQTDWEEINFFDHEFSEDIGNILFGNKPESGSFSLMSPDCTADGWLKKKWKIIGGTRCLVKGGASFFQEPFNEVIASMTAQALKIPHVEYRLAFEGKNHMPVSVCADFITRDTELISASAVSRVLPREESESKYQHFVKCCQHLKIPGYVKSLDEMLTLDYIIANQDRHMGNFGVLRNADTLKYIGFAPMFDCGTSLRYDTPTGYIDPDLNVESQPFADFHDEQIRLVKHPEAFDLKALDGIEDKIMEIFQDERASAYIDEKRQIKIREVLKRRWEKLDMIFTQDMYMENKEVPEISM